MAERNFGYAARRTVEKRLKRLLRDGRGALDAGNLDALHALRIDVKRLRYNLEFVAPLLAERAREPLALLATAQDHFGTLADADAFGRTYAAMLADLPAESDRRPGLQRLCDDAARERQAALEGVRTFWRGEGTPYPERLAASISAALGSLSKDEGS
jgi:CHAD domain-containing protein